MDRNYSAMFFGVRRSAIYHWRRYEFLSNSAFCLLAASALSLAAAVAGVFAGNFTALFAGLMSAGGALAAAGTVVRRSDKYFELHRRFEDLAAGGPPKTVAGHNRMKAAREGIEADEPPIYRIVDTFAHNELTRMLHPAGADEWCVKTRWWMRFTGHFTNLGLKSLTTGGLKGTAS